jgi:hypothetical protein
MRARQAPGGLAALFTALAAAFAISAGPAGAQQPDPAEVLDHFRCYQPEAVGDPIASVGLLDQFGPDTVATASPFQLCNPVRKTVLGGPPSPEPLNPDAHLVCYSHEPRFFDPLVVRVSNQFGEDTLQVFGPDRLCVPASKAVELPDGSLPEAPPLGDIEQRLDHFRCYLVSGAVLPPPVVLGDQFATSQAFVGQASRLCNPVEKRRPGFPVTPINRPFAHLVCYPLSAEPFAGPPDDAATGSQFGAVRFFEIDLFSNFGELCVPSSKEVREPPRVPEHFKGYDVVDAVPAFRRENILLIDQFGEQVVRQERPRELLVPVEKRREGRAPEPIQRPNEHLKCYGIDGPELNRTVRVRNQFTESTLVVMEPTRLCTPASKTVSGQPGAPPSDLDHMKCYRAARERPAFRSEVVTLRDQFGEERVRLGAARFLCAPVAKERSGRPLEPRIRPNEHLVCYRFTELFTPFTPRRVSTRDQFGLQSVTVRTPRMLCVPSEKELVG